ncbi:hypothetical protein [Kaarinaea lacus]
MKITKEALTGIIVLLAVLAVIAITTGIYGIFYMGLALIIAIVSVNIFSRKSVAAKTGAVVLNTDLIYKILMPNKYKKAIKELENKEKHDSI